MKCYRVYVDDEVVATVFSLAQVAEVMDSWIYAGYKPTFRREDF